MSERVYKSSQVKWAEAKVKEASEAGNFEDFQNYDQILKLWQGHEQREPVQ